MRLCPDLLRNSILTRDAAEHNTLQDIATALIVPAVECAQFPAEYSLGIGLRFVSSTWALALRRGPPWVLVKAGTNSAA